eukprot:7914603-Pyramimonas_sp.AAC.1
MKTALRIQGDAITRDALSRESAGRRRQRGGGQERSNLCCRVCKFGLPRELSRPARVPETEELPLHQVWWNGPC